MDTSSPSAVNFTAVVPVDDIPQVHESEILERIEVLSENFSQLTIVFILITIAILLIGGVAITAFWMAFRVPESDSLSHKNQNGTDEKSHANESKNDYGHVSAQANEDQPPTDEPATKKFATLSPSSSTASVNRGTNTMFLTKFTSLPGYCAFEQVVPSDSMSQKSIDLHSLKNSLLNWNLDAGQTAPLFAENKECQQGMSSMGSIKSFDSFYCKEAVSEVNLAEEEELSGRYCSFCACDGTSRGTFYRNPLPLSPFGSFLQNELQQLELPESRRSSESFDPSILDMTMEELMSSESFDPSILDMTMEELMSSESFDPSILDMTVEELMSSESFTLTTEL